jgi:hypothetical protein
LGETGVVTVECGEELLRKTPMLPLCGSRTEVKHEGEVFVVFCTKNRGHENPHAAMVVWSKENSSITLDPPPEKIGDN